MSGVHRGVAESPVITAAKAARWLITGSAIVAIPLALLALSIYLMVIGTDLERSAAVWLIWMALLVSAIVQRRRDLDSFRWIAAGTGLAATWELASAFIRQRGWRGGRLHVIALIGNWTYLPAFACLGVGIFIGIRSGSLGWRRSAPDSPPDTSTRT